MSGPALVSIRDLETGRLEFECMGLTPFADVPPSPYYRPMPGFWLGARAWLDKDGQHVVIAHDCRAGRDVHIAAWPTWQAHGDDVTPSYSCDLCGVHTFLKIAWAEA